MSVSPRRRFHERLDPGGFNLHHVWEAATERAFLVDPGGDAAGPVRPAGPALRFPTHLRYP